MKKLFKAIRQSDLDEVKAILEKNPEAVSSVASPPPKKDIGQSPLQVAVKIGEFDIAYYLMEHGADVNFMEEEAEGVTQRMPVLHDAIARPSRAFVTRTRRAPQRVLSLCANC